MKKTSFILVMVSMALLISCHSKSGQRVSERKQQQETMAFQHKKDSAEFLSSMFLSGTISLNSLKEDLGPFTSTINYGFQFNFNSDTARRGEFSLVLINGRTIPVTEEYNGIPIDAVIQIREILRDSFPEMKQFNQGKYECFYFGFESTPDWTLDHALKILKAIEQKTGWTISKEKLQIQEAG